MRSLARALDVHDRGDARRTVVLATKSEDTEARAPHATGQTYS